LFIPRSRFPWVLVFLNQMVFKQRAMMRSVSLDHAALIFAGANVLEAPTTPHVSVVRSYHGTLSSIYLVLHSSSMRKPFALVLAIPLLAMTSWASACDLSCSLERSHSDCKLDGAAVSRDQSQASADMAMDPSMDMSDAASLAASDSNGLVHLHANTCTHNPCNETSASAISKSAAQHPLPTLLQATAFDAPFIVTLSHESPGASDKQKPPTLQPFDPLSVSLRL
jgi:hypothetical protein